MDEWVHERFEFAEDMVTRLNAIKATSPVVFDVRTIIYKDGVWEVTFYYKGAGLP